MLKDGASAVYGSDAIGGVVNIILRRDHKGGEVGISGGTSTEGGLNEYRANLAQAWATWPVTSSMFSAQWTVSRDLLLASERDWTKDQDTRALSRWRAQLGQHCHLSPHPRVPFSSCGVTNPGNTRARLATQPTGTPVRVQPRASSRCFRSPSGSLLGAALSKSTGTPRHSPKSHSATTSPFFKRFHARRSEPDIRASKPRDGWRNRCQWHIACQQRQQSICPGGHQLRFSMSARATRKSTPSRTAWWAGSKARCPVGIGRSVPAMRRTRCKQSTTTAGSLHPDASHCQQHV